MNRPTRRIAPKLKQDLTKLPLDEAARIAGAQAARPGDGRIDPGDVPASLRIGEELVTLLREEDLLALASRLSDLTRRIVSHKSIRTILVQELGRFARSVEAFARVQAGEVGEVPIELQPLAAQRRIFDIFARLFQTERFAAFFHGNYAIEDKIDHEHKTLAVLIHEREHMILPPIPQHQQEGIKVLVESVGVPNKAVAEPGQMNSQTFLERLAAIFLPPPAAKDEPTFTPPEEAAADAAAPDGEAARVEEHPPEVQTSLLEG